MAKTEPLLSPAEVARRLGVSAKALRLYEQRGLIRPVRGENGWRWFGAAEIARLHQVLALKALRLPLARIAEVLVHGHASLDQVLAVHEAALAADAQRAQRALSLVRAARRRLAGGQDLSTDDLAMLAKETTMPLKSGQKELGALLDTHVRAHFSPAEIEAAATRSFDQETIGAQWDALVAEAKALMAEGDPTSAAARDLARRWKAQVEAFTGGDPDLWNRAGAVWRDAMADPAAAPKLPLTPEMFAFIGQAMAAETP
ncbi:MAG TPA: MerR family transcriptional regulator [Caulobacteraceae bacterium]|nr:MerR family transcriptional regulator [Caulobacteraceae bacterium]